MSKMISTLIIIATLFSSSSFASMAEKINFAASNALEETSYKEQGEKILLYGVRTNGPDTAGGKLACAKVTTIVLKEAGALDKVSLGVRHVEADLSSWQKIENEEDLKPGDVIVWVNRFNGREDKKCTGYGNCHVGIVTDKGYFHNSPISHAPTYGGISLLGFYFKVGFRPPS